MSEIITRAELERGRNLAGTTYLATYVRLMMDEMDVMPTNGRLSSGQQREMNEMAVDMLPFMDLGVGIGWGIVMNDEKFARKHLQQLTDKVTEKFG